MRPKIFIAASLIYTLSTSVVQAECFARSAIINQSDKSITRITDIKQFVVPLANNQFKCNVTFRAEVNHVWHTAEGQSIGANGDSIDQICSQALQAGRSYFISKMGGKFATEQEMICRDDPLPTVKTVRIGDVVQLSEVSPHPTKPNIFDYKGTKCRWFVEADFDPNKRDIMQHQGIVCLVRKGEWQVIDKF